MDTIEQSREWMCEIGRRIWQRQFIAANDGNFSVRLEANRFLCTPTLVSKGFMKPADMVIIDSDMNVVEGSNQPTSEIRMHLEIYRQRPDLTAVVHAHPPHATAFAITSRQIPSCLLPEIEFYLGVIPIAPYVNPGTWEFAQSLIPAIQKSNALLLKNHGAVAAGTSLLQAYHRMESVEHYCRVLILALQLGGWDAIPAGSVREMLSWRAATGDIDPRLNLPDDQLCNVAGMSTNAPPLPDAPVSAEAIRSAVIGAVERLRKENR